MTLVIKVTNTNVICSISEKASVNDAFERQPITVKNQYETVLTVKELESFKQEEIKGSEGKYNCYWYTYPVNISRTSSYTVSIGKWQTIAQPNSVISVDAETLKTLAF
jgi:hypothetical protein